MTKGVWPGHAAVVSSGGPQNMGQDAGKGAHVRSRKRKTLPVRPPTLPSVLESPLAAPAMAGPAALETRDRPLCAAAWYSLALPAASWAAPAAFWLVELSKRRPAKRRAGERRRGRARDMTNSDFDGRASSQLQKGEGDRQFGALAGEERARRTIRMAKGRAGCEGGVACEKQGYGGEEMNWEDLGGEKKPRSRANAWKWKLGYPRIGRGTAPAASTSAGRALVQGWLG